MTWNIPIALTWLRILLIPMFTLMFFLPFEGGRLAYWVNWAAAGIFIVASVTDWFDGFLARRWNQTSDFGAFLDPVADKLMVATALILLVYLERTSPVAAMIIIGREITISALREWMAQLGKRNSVAVARLGKFKTAAQMAAVILLLIDRIPMLGWDFYIIGNILMALACILTIWSMLYYLKLAADEFKAAA